MKVNSVYSPIAKQYIHDVLGISYSALDLRKITRGQFDYLYMLARRQDRKSHGYA